jgi:hypothetical protein
MNRLAALLLLVAGLLAVGLGRAQGAPEVRLQADATVVGVGDVVHVQMSATSSEAMPDDPRLGPTPGFTLRGQNASPSQTHIIMNGVSSDRYSLTVDWALEATRTGTFNVGPASVVVKGARVVASPIALRVVPAGQAPPRQRRAQPPPMPFGFSPFDPWRGLFPAPGVEPEPPPQPTVTADPKLALDAPLGPYLFLHTVVDKTSAVVGEQVAFTAYLYVDPSAPRLNQDDLHEAEANDFVKHALTRDDDENIPLAGYAAIAGRAWQVLLLRRWALFPLHAGDLTIGPMSLRVTTGQGVQSTRKSEVLHVHVTEPPLAGRPPGYAMGDVGRFTLSAQVQPREAAQGGAVGVHVELSGTGNLPSQIATPARAGVEWLAPEVHDKMGAVGQEGFGGTRSFDYVVRIKDAGAVDLGELRLPFWSPEKKHYDVARAALGVVNVTAVTGSGSTSSEAPPELLPGLPGPRDHLEGGGAVRRHLDDSPLFWLVAVGGAPIAFVFAVASRAAGRRVTTAWRQRRTSPLAELRERTAAARAACARGDGRETDAAVARALEAATIAHAAVNVRGAAGSGEIAERLGRGGVPREVAERVGALLGQCEGARFSPEAVDPLAARERWSQAQNLIRQLEKRG